MNPYPSLMKLVADSSDEDRDLMTSTIQKLDEAALGAFEATLRQLKLQAHEDIPEAKTKADPIDSCAIWKDFVSARNELIKLRQSHAFLSELAQKLPTSPVAVDESIQPQYWNALTCSIEQQHALVNQILEVERRLKSLKAYLLAELEF